MEEKINKEFIPRLLDHAIKYHSRRGVRWWCDCSFCTAKKIGTGRIGNFRWVSVHATSYSNKYPWRASYIYHKVDPDRERFAGATEPPPYFVKTPIPRPYEAIGWNDFEWNRDGEWIREDHRRRVVAATREAERVKLREELAYQLKQVF